MSRSVYPFNTPLEAGLRALFVLASCGRRALDVERLVYLDYALVHTADFGGPDSVHPWSPSKRSQLLVRRAVVQEGLALMQSRELVERVFLSTGIAFRATSAGRHLVDIFTSAYAVELRVRADWIASNLTELSDAKIRRVFADRTGPLDDEVLPALVTPLTVDAQLGLA